MNLCLRRCHRAALHLLWFLSALVVFSLVPVDPFALSVRLEVLDADEAAFSFPDDRLVAIGIFVAEKKKERQTIETHAPVKTSRYPGKAKDFNATDLIMIIGRLLEIQCYSNFPLLFPVHVLQNT